ncbi:MAG: hypothetical protein ACQEWU_19580 [Bacillota bacterium]|uniref:hypothetical protein n=1 Tax=Virgibacillus TaxID=84406 RepID=UPI001D1675D6|nr:MULTISPECIES: hypothetical protein [Virgibacillus]MCC2252736.1 hypothetical protein [Virgibacillus sp. AGTR]WBX79478.1 hypothetical protein PD280_17515 [Virgibacillus salarius]
MLKNQTWKSFHIDDFNDLKEKAYKVARIMINKKHDNRWLDKYIDQFAPSSTVWLFEDVILLYVKYHNNNITKDEAISCLESMESKYLEGEKLLRKVMGFHIAINEAFKKEDKEYGEVTFECPFCEGAAYAKRLHTPNNFAHKTTIRAKCSNCGHNVMN